MRRLFWIGGAAAGLAVAAAVGTGTAMAPTPAAASAPFVGTATTQDTGGTESPDAPLSGSDRDKATQAALAHTGGGSVTETETGDDGAAYGVEIRKPDGRHVEVHLDGGFAVVGEEADDNDAD